MAAEKRERLCNIKNTREPKRLVFPKMQLYQRVEDRSGAGGADTQSSKTALKSLIKKLRAKRAYLKSRKIVFSLEISTLRKAKEFGGSMVPKT